MKSITWTRRPSDSPDSLPNQERAARLIDKDSTKTVERPQITEEMLEIDARHGSARHRVLRNMARMYARYDRT